MNAKRTPKIPRKPAGDRPKPAARTKSASPGITGLFALTVCMSVVFLLGWYVISQVHARYTFSLQLPVRLQFQWPIVIAHRSRTETAAEAQTDQQGHALTAYQQYACEKFGPDCRLALAIQRAENPHGRCEIYHYNTDGTLDWGYFQINTVHLKRPGLNLHDLLDCKANIDFAYQLYQEQQGFSSWSTYKSGTYRRFMRTGSR